MNNRRSATSLHHGEDSALLTTRMLTDMVLVGTAWVLAFHIRFHTLLSVTHGIPNQRLYFKLLPFIVIIWFAVWWTAGLYRRSQRQRSAFIEAIDVIQCSVLATAAFIAFSFFYEEYRYSRITLAIFTVLHPMMVIVGRSLIRKILRYRRRHAPPRRTLIIGGGAPLRQAIPMIDLELLSSGEIAGVIAVGRDADEDMAFCKQSGIPVVDVPTDWAAHFAAHPAETVIFAVPHDAYDFLATHLEQIVDQVADIRLVPDLVRYARLGAGIDIVQGVPIISIHESPLAGIGSALKRGMDMIGSLSALLVFSPIMAIVAAGVRISSPGPVLYRQERMGLDGRTFHILKFRSMPVNAESATGAKWATADDDRATRFGGFIRKSSLDELPQLFNVLAGDMSLVGPRPERPVFVHDFRTKIPGYMLRHKVKAGITGWAQVNGWRGNTSLERRIECDLWYIQNWSLWLDIKILFFTVFKGFVHKNAY